MNSRKALDTWLFRLKGPEPGRIVLSQRRIFLLPTRAGLAYALALVPMLLASINYNLSLGYLFTFLLAGLGVVAILHGFRNLLGLSLRPGKAEPVFVGAMASFGLIFAEDRNRTRFALSAHLKDGPATAFDLPSGQETPVNLTRPASRRGWMNPGRLTLETHYPLGLIRAWSYLEPDMLCLVYPCPETQPPPLPLGSGTGQAGMKPGDEAEDFMGLRPYRPLDSPRRIAWKAMTADGNLMVKQFSGGEETQPWLKWRDLPPTMDVEARLSRLTAWLLEARSAGLSCGLTLPGFSRAPASDEGHYLECLTALAEYE